MKRLIISIWLLCLTMAVFGVTYPSKPYRSTNFEQRHDYDVLVPFSSQSPRVVRPIVGSQSSRQIVALPFGQNAAMLHVVSSGTLQSYGGGLSAGVAHGNYSGLSRMSDATRIIAPITETGHISQPKQLANTAEIQLIGQDQNPTYRGDPPGTGGDNPENPDIWVPVGDGIYVLLLLLIAYMFLIINPNRSKG